MGLDDDIRMLARAPLLAEIGRDGLRLVAFSAETRWLAPGEVLFEKGQAADGGYVVVNGRLLLSAGAGGPPRQAGPGTLLGETALFVETEHLVTAAAQHAASVLSIPRLLFRRMLQEYPEAAETLMRRMSRRIQDERLELDAARRLLLDVDQRWRGLAQGRGEVKDRGEG
ncbi:MAG TPA: Crp/Fnr family transcriptional regulator [Hyphomicrobiales bacterium]|nr:Crp/Fnr family transcriptional regulator [Hyphomicrobiales bacterium]